MARLGKAKLFTRIVSAIEADGWSVTLSSQPMEHPLRFTMTKGQVAHRVRAYIWNLTHGGGAKRPQHEQRIQITKVSQFEPEPEGTTLILGWADAAGIFAAFDITHHTRPLGSSPSIQIGAGALDQAALAGIATQPKGNREVAVAVRPDRLAAYIGRFEEAHAGQIDLILVPPADTVDFNALASPEHSHNFGNAAERAQRRSVLDRLAALEREMETIRPQLGLMGHNNPPESTEPDPGVLANEIAGASDYIRNEFVRDEPDIAAVGRGAAILQRLWTLLRFTRDEAGKFGQSVKKKAHDKAADLLVGAVVSGGVLYGPQIVGALQAVVDSITRWFQLILG